jgi:hypothetical protein
VTGKVVQLVPNDAIAPNNATVAKRIYQLGDAIASDKHGQVSRFVAVMVCDGVPQMPVVYGQPCDFLQLVGLLEFAQRKAILEGLQEGAGDL